MRTICLVPNLGGHDFLQMIPNIPSARKEKREMAVAFECTRKSPRVRRFLEKKENTAQTHKRNIKKTETKRKLRVVYGIPHLGGHDFPQLVFRTTPATIGRGNIHLTNRRGAQRSGHLSISKGGEVYGQPQMGSLTPYWGSRSKNGNGKEKKGQSNVQ